jgi:hypothetical protein
MSMIASGGEDMSFKISWKVHLLCFLMACGICFIMNDLINDLLFNIMNEIKITQNVLVDCIIFVVLIFIPITFVHELLHGVTYTLFGGKVKYGFKGIYAYTKEVSGIVLHRNQFLIVLVAPVTIISMVSIFVPGGLSKFIFVLNLVGSTGDLLMAFYLCKGNENTYVVDREYGFDMVSKSI